MFEIKQKQQKGMMFVWFVLFLVAIVLIVWYISRISLPDVPLPRWCVNNYHLQKWFALDGVQTTPSQFNRELFVQH